MGEPAPQSESGWQRWVNGSPRGSFGALADVVGVAGAVITAIGLAVRQDFETGVMAVVLGLITMASLSVTWRLERALAEHERMARYRERVSGATPGLAGSLGDLSRAMVALTSTSDDSAKMFVQHCEAACREFSRALQALTGVSCRVTLQEVYVPTTGPDDDFAVKPIASSYGLAARSRGNGEVDRVRDNTDFSRLFALDEVYLVNDLPDEVASGYKNSHWTPERLAEWRRTGAYPYRSTVVWPLRGLVDDPASDDPLLEIAGFLSVDAPESGIFDRDTVVPLGQAFAHTAYSGLMMYRVWKEEELWRD